MCPPTPHSHIAKDGCRRCFEPLPTSHTRSAQSWSNPLSGIDRIMTVEFSPRPLMKPAHSRATYEAPTTRVLPGELGREKRSSEVMQSSLGRAHGHRLGVYHRGGSDHMVIDRNVV